MNNITIIIAALLLLCLAPMPYGYYMLVRWSAMVVFAVTAFNYYAENNKELAVTFGGIGIAVSTIHKDCFRPSDMEHRRCGSCDIAFGFNFHEKQKRKSIRLWDAA